MEAGGSEVSGWGKYEMYVKTTLDDLKRGQMALTVEVIELRVEVGKLQVWAVVGGAVAGFAGSAVLTVIAFALKFVRPG